jgi:hypothetical protein
VTSLKLTNDVSDQGTAVPGGGRRWRAFSLLAVAFFMTIMDVLLLSSEHTSPHVRASADM